MELVKILINGHKNTNQFLFRYINNKKSKIKKKITNICGNKIIFKRITIKKKIRDRHKRRIANFHFCSY